MDSFFGIGLPELVMILLLASLVMGPQRIRQVARTLGRITAQLQAISREFARQLNSELDALDETNEMKGAMQDIKALQDEVKSLRRELAQGARSLKQDTEQAVQNGRQPTSPPPDEEQSPTTPSVPPPPPLDIPDDPE